MKALTREQSQQAVDVINSLVKMVENYAKSHGHGSTVPPEGKLHDALALADACVEGRGFIRSIDDTAERMAYQMEVIKHLTTSPLGTRSERPRRTLSDEERQELADAYESGRPSEAFARMLADRDVMGWKRELEPIT